MTEKSPFESMTPESIKSEMLGRVINAGVDVDAREGSYANILLSEAAYVMWKYGQTLNGFIDILFPGAQSGRYLDLHAGKPVSNGDLFRRQKAQRAWCAHNSPRGDLRAVHA